MMPSCTVSGGTGCYKAEGDSSRTISDLGGHDAMGLKAPGILVFMLSIILAVLVLVVRFFGAEIPLIKGHEFWGLLAAYIILLLGNLMRGL